MSKKTVLLIDAKNAFNCLNRILVVENIKKICPVLVQNSFSALSDLYVSGITLQSLEFTTQGDRIAMAVFGVGTFPLIRLVQNGHVSQKWHADNGSVVGRLEDLLLFLKLLIELVCCFRYSVIALRCQLIVNEASNIKSSQVV